jgi:hypothetical protein
VAQDVNGRVVVEAGGRGDGGDDVVGTADAETLAALVEKQRRTVVGGGPVVALVKPAREGGAQLRVHRDMPDAFAFAFAEDPQDACARGARDVVDVERDDLADPRAGVERDERERPVARRRAALNFAQVAQLGALVQRARRVAASSMRAALAGPRPRRM